MTPKKTKAQLDAEVLEAMDFVFEGGAHPLRRRLLGALEGFAINGGDGASPNELSKLIDEPLTNVSYHVRELAKRELIEQYDEQPRRGALEHFYRLTPLGTVLLDTTLIVREKVAAKGVLA